MKQTILITGGTGFLGKRLALRLKADNRVVLAGRNNKHNMNGKTATRFACVRHGNIAWSTGSVFPLWKQMHDNTGVIGSTGPDMTRYFSKVDEAVDLVTTALQNIEQLQGCVVSRQMKSALIRDILDLWIREKGGRWEKIEGRPGERPHEYLIGEPEL